MVNPKAAGSSPARDAFLPFFFLHHALNVLLVACFLRAKRWSGLVRFARHEFLLGGEA